MTIREFLLAILGRKTVVRAQPRTYMKAISPSFEIRILRRPRRLPAIILRTPPRLRLDVRFGTAEQAPISRLRTPPRGANQASSLPRIPGDQTLWLRTSANELRGMLFAGQQEVVHEVLKRRSQSPPTSQANS